MAEHGSAVDAVTEVERAIAIARASGHFMVSVWWLEPSGERRCAKTSWQWPKQQMEPAVQQLVQLLEAELEQRETTPPPLPMAKIFDAALQPSATSPSDCETEQDSEEQPHG